MGRIEVKKIYDHECSCCIYKDTLVRDGEWIAATTKPKQSKLALEKATKRQGNSPNITCIKGTLYLVEKYDNGKKRVISPSNSEIEEKEERNKKTEKDPEYNRLKSEYYTESNPYLESIEDHTRGGKIDEPFWTTEKNGLITNSDGRKGFDSCLERCIENNIFGEISKIMFKQIYETSIRKIGFLVDENSMTLESTVETTSLLQLYTANVQTFLTRYSHASDHGKVKECSYAYSIDTNACFHDHCHIWPRLTQFTRLNEDEVLPKGWRVNAIKDAFKNSKSNIQKNSRFKEKIAFVLFMSMPNELVDHKRWIDNNVPKNLIDKIVSGGDIVFILCASENSISFKMITDKGESNSLLQYWEYGKERHIKDVNLCLADCHDGQNIYGEIIQKQQSLQDFMASDKCIVRIFRTKMEEERIQKWNEDVSGLCKDVIAEGSVCTLYKKKQGIPYMKSEFTKTERTPHNRQFAVRFTNQKTSSGLTTMSATTPKYSMDQNPSTQMPKLNTYIIEKHPSFRKEYHLTTMSTTIPKLSMNQNSPINANPEKIENMDYMAMDMDMDMDMNMDMDMDMDHGYGKEYYLNNLKPALTKHGAENNYMKYTHRALNIQRYSKPHTPQKHKLKAFENDVSSTQLLDALKKGMKLRTNGAQGQYPSDGRSGRYWGFDRL